DTITKTNKAIRPPIVVVMGHIDHGKTTILDWYRKTKVVDAESGGITQHIGAYQITLMDADKNADQRGSSISVNQRTHPRESASFEERKITFIDTPGHEAFSKIRARGARVADLAILVVAADEGVKPQTKEALDIIHGNNLPFVVALNKSDKEEANPERVKQELAKEEVLVESFGGKVPVVEISAKSGKNMEELLEVLLILAELEDLEAHPEKPGEGVIIEAHLDPRRGITATLLVTDGTFRKKDVLAAGKAVENIKILEDFQGHPILSAGPSSPVRVAGLGEMPLVGDRFRMFLTKSEAEQCIKTLPEIPVDEKSAVPLISEGEKSAKPIFNIIIKTDAAGSREALEDALKKIESDAIGINVLWSGIGDINESDVKRARATRLVTIIGFKVRMDPAVRALAQKSNIHIVTGEVIYDLLDQVKHAASDIIPPEIKRILLGKVKILKVFKKEGQKQVIGGRVEEGKLKKGARMEITRGKEVIGIAGISQLQREKTPVEEVSGGAECGMMVEMKAAIQEGDIGEAFEEEVTRKVL
ncbi:MAG: bacterial translation initiation factor 2 (bIF-2), partial [Parcubacteria group bacterium Gr01-1014_33]